MQDWRTYDDVAETYEHVHAPRTARIARDLVAMVDPPGAGRVLDVGTGTGVAAEAALDAVGDGGLVVGVDVSVPMLQVALRSGRRARFVAASAIDLPFPDGDFDTIVANFVISHFTKYETALFDVLRVLRHGGRIAVSSWADRPDDLTKTWAELVESVVGPELLEDARNRAAPWANRFADRNAIEDTLISAGLRHVRTEQREYRFVYALDEYVQGLQTGRAGRFVRSMLGDRAWADFLSRAGEVFADRFADPVNDFRDVWLAVGTKEP